MVYPWLEVAYPWNHRQTFTSQNGWGWKGPLSPSGPILDGSIYPWWGHASYRMKIKKLIQNMEWALKEYHQRHWKLEKTKRWEYLRNDLTMLCWIGLSVSYQNPSEMELAGFEQHPCSPSTAASRSVQLCLQLHIKSRAVRSIWVTEQPVQH